MTLKCHTILLFDRLNQWLKVVDVDEKLYTEYDPSGVVFYVEELAERLLGCKEQVCFGMIQLQKGGDLDEK